MIRTERQIEIQKWLLDQSLTQSEIAKKANVSRTTIHQFVKGFVSSRRLVSLFEELGCPKELLEKRAA
ncbi:MAG: helix-turn-helix transcriptional regulator [Candidatus Riflebacteria bacterium]|nr:helix-turn-helix transcriptional regulator [Candidatus Riflebacteria bacterium]